MSLIVWIVFGIVAGIISYLISPNSKEGGVLGAMAVGVMGSLLGGLLASLIFQTGISNISWLTLFTAFVGSIAFLIAEQTFGERTS
jgi:uncharacterized membrane protein YeaQ/YmgE (transglycosylase-associated protein family)